MELRTIQEIIRQHKVTLPEEYEIEFFLNPETGNAEVKITHGTFFITQEFGPQDSPLDLSGFIDQSCRYIDNMVIKDYE